MSETTLDSASQPTPAAARERLAFDLDVDICVVGAGLAGLTVALEAARLGASVAVLEGRHVGWNASGHQLGTVMPGYGVPLGELIERVGREDARELWALSRLGAEAVRANATETLMPDIAVSEGALEVSNIDVGDQLIRRLQMLSEDLETEVEGWQVDRVRGALKTGRYFHGVYYPKAFQLDGRRYVHGLANLAQRAGARIFEDTPVVSIDSSGIRKRIVTPSARLRASHVVLAGNVHLGAPMRRLWETLLPVWRYAGITAPLGERLAETVGFQGSVMDSDGVDHFRIVDGDRLMWASPETTWAMRPSRFAGAIARRIQTVFPALGRVDITETFGGATGQTVHGMPQIGQLRRGLWVASGFGRHGLATSGLAGQLIARSILWGDDRWRLFAPFELVWAGGVIGRAAGQIRVWVKRLRAAVEERRARARELAHWQARLNAAETAPQPDTDAVSELQSAASAPDQIDSRVARSETQPSENPPPETTSAESAPSESVDPASEPASTERAAPRAGRQRKRARTSTGRAVEHDAEA